MQISLEPIMPLPLAVALGGGFLALLLLSISTRPANYRQGLDYCFRLVTGLIFVVILLNPVRSQTASKAQRPTLTVMLDTSLSMTQPISNTEHTTRLQKAHTLLTDPTYTSRLDTQFSTEYATFQRTLLPTDHAQLLSIPADGDATDLGMAISSVTAGLRAHGVESGALLIVSDGRNNGRSDPVEAAKTAQDQGFTISTLTVGTASAHHRLALRCLTPELLARAGQNTEARIELESEGAKAVTLLIEREGRPYQRIVVSKPPVHQLLHIPLRESTPGYLQFTCRVVETGSAAPGPTADFSLTVTRERRRLLYLEGRPGWDSHFLTRFLAGSGSYDLDTLMMLTPTLPVAQSGSSTRTEIKPPRTIEDWGEYDAVLLGRDCEPLVSSESQQSLAHWVTERGGVVIFTRGAPFRTTAGPIADLCPVLFQSELQFGGRIQLANDQNSSVPFLESSASATALKELPELYSVQRSNGIRPAAQILMRAQFSGGQQPLPLLAEQRVGAGRALVFAGSGLWRLAFPPPAQTGWAFFYSDFWHGILNRALRDSPPPGTLCRLRSDRPEYEPGEAVGLTLTTRHPFPASSITATVQDPAGVYSSITLTRSAECRLEAAFTPHLPGRYRIMVPEGSTLGKAVCSFRTLADSAEARDLTPNPELMRRLAETGSGIVVKQDELAHLPDRLHQLVVNNTKQRAPRSLWDRGALLTLLMLLLCGSWVLHSSRRTFA